MKKQNAYTRIQNAKKENERWIVSHIRSLMKVGQGWDPHLMRISMWNSLERLEERGRVKYSKKVHGYILVTK